MNEKRKENNKVNLRNKERIDKTIIYYRKK